MPSGTEIDHILEVFPEIRRIGDNNLREHVIGIWREIIDEMSWDSIKHVPKNNSSEKHRTLVDHINGVTAMAMSLADVAERFQGAKINRDALLVAALLHDASKPLETEPDPGVPFVDETDRPRPSRTSALGSQIQHAVYVAHKMFERNMPLDLINLVITHTHQSNVRGKTIEAAILFYADFADSDVGLSGAGEKMFAERWVLA